MNTHHPKELDGYGLWNLLKQSWLDPAKHEEALSSAKPEILASAIGVGLRRGTPDGLGMNRSEWHDVNDFLTSHPHFLLGSDFDEARIFHREQHSRTLPPELDFFYKKFFPDFPPFFKRTKEVLLRQKNTSVWHIFNLKTDDDYPVNGEMTLDFLGANGHEKSISRDKYISDLESNLSSSICSTHITAVFDTIWTPPQIQKESIHAFSFTSDLIEQIKFEKIQLEDVAWRQLEEIVAELLARRGFQIQLTKQTRDGGRDVIAVGEFFPGIKIEMAVEVTKRKKVGIEKVSKALYQNRHYPKLMVATSGAFSSEVIREQNLPENRLRLILRDGNSLRDWILNGS